MCSTPRGESWPCWPSTPAASGRKEASWATRPVWRNYRSGQRRSYGPVRRRARSAEWPGKRARPSSSARRQDTTRSSSRQWGWGRARRHATPWSTSSCLSNWQELATSCRASSVASWRSPMASSSTNATATTSTNATWRPPTSATRSTSSPSRRVDGCQRCSAIAGSTDWESKRCGTWSTSTSTS